MPAIFILSYCISGAHAFLSIGYSVSPNVSRSHLPPSHFFLGCFSGHWELLHSFYEKVFIATLVRMLGRLMGLQWLLLGWGISSLLFGWANWRWKLQQQQGFWPFPIETFEWYFELPLLFVFNALRFAKMVRVSSVIAVGLCSVSRTSYVSLYTGLKYCS